MKSVKLNLDNSIRRYKKEIAEDILKQRADDFGETPGTDATGDTPAGRGSTSDCDPDLCAEQLSFDAVDNPVIPESGAVISFTELDDEGSGVFSTPGPSRGIRETYLDGILMVEGQHYTTLDADSIDVVATLVPGTAVAAKYTAW